MEWKDKHDWNSKKGQIIKRKITQKIYKYIFLYNRNVNYIEMLILPKQN